MYLVFNLPPTGYEEVGTDWIVDLQLSKRINYNRDTIEKYLHNGANMQYLIHKFANRPVDDLIRYVLDLYIGDTYSQEEFDLIKELIPEGFVISSETENIKVLKSIFFIVASMPRANLH